MTDVVSSIIDLLCTHLEDLQLSPAVSLAMPNVPFAPVTGETYMRASVMFADTNQPALSHDSHRRFQGIFQVSVFAPLDEGPVKAAVIADLVADQFARGTRLTDNDLIVEIGPAPPTINTPIKEEERWHQPCSIPWFALVPE